MSNKKNRLKQTRKCLKNTFSFFFLLIWLTMFKMINHLSAFLLNLFCTETKTTYHSNHLINYINTTKLMCGIFTVLHTLIYHLELFSQTFFWALRKFKTMFKIWMYIVIWNQGVSKTGLTFTYVNVFILISCVLPSCYSNNQNSFLFY